MTAVETDYSRELVVPAPTSTVFDALTTVEGIAGWWTPLVDGVPTAGGRVRLAFKSPTVDQKILIRVAETREAAVTWTVIRHSGHPEWEGTTIRFDLDEDWLGETRLRFRHEGLVPELDCYDVCERGWDHFLASLAGYATNGHGAPFGA